MTGIETREWEQVRAQGRDRFVLREGIAKRGLREASILLTIWIILHVFRKESVPGLVDLWTSFAGFCVVLLGAGWYEGVRLWDTREKEYEEYQSGGGPNQQLETTADRPVS